MSGMRSYKLSLENIQRHFCHFELCSFLTTVENLRLLKLWLSQARWDLWSMIRDLRPQFPYWPLSHPCKNGLFFLLAHYRRHYDFWKHSLLFIIVPKTDIMHKYQGSGCLLAFYFPQNNWSFQIPATLLFHVLSFFSLCSLTLGRRLESTAWISDK